MVDSNALLRWVRIEQFNQSLSETIHPLFTFPKQFNLVIWQHGKPELLSFLFMRLLSLILHINIVTFIHSVLLYNSLYLLWLDSLFS